MQPINKIIIQGILLIALFFGIFFGLSQIDFIKVFHIRQTKLNTANKLGDVLWKQVEESEVIIYNDTLQKTLDSLITPILEANDIPKDSIRLHLVENSQVNAFAMPNNHLVVFTGLIKDCKKQEALQAVLGHEIAHIRKNHVMQKLSKEIGLTVLLSAAGGNGTLIREILKTLSSTAYDRALEKEADLTAVDYLLKAKINPKPMADFMYQLAQKSDMPEGFGWISTHPESEDRARYILSYLKGKKLENKQMLSPKSWETFKTRIAEED
jgi:predicted Zn-dependent protease